MTRRLAHEPLGWRPTMLEVLVRRYRCTGCGHVLRQDTALAAEPRARLSRRGLRWALEGIVVQHLTVAGVLGVAWNTANDAVLAESKRVLIDDEHAWRHTRRGDKYVTVIIDLTGIRNGSGPARLLHMVEGRSKHAFKTWLAERPTAWRDTVEVVAMDGFTGFRTATTEELPDAVAVMDPFHVVRLAGDALDRCRRQVQLAIHGHRGLNRRYGLHLDQLVVVAQRRDAQQSARRVVLAETVTHHLPRRDQVGLARRSHVHGGLDDVAELRAGLRERDLEVVHHLAGLTGEVTGCDGVALGVKRARARGEDQAIGLEGHRGGVGVLGNGRQPGTTDESDGSCHGWNAIGGRNRIRAAHRCLRLPAFLIIGTWRARH